MSTPMQRFLIVAAVCILPARYAAAHCEVPCGIYGDQRRFEQMLEDQQTIAKAIATVGELVGQGEISAQDVNQMARWVQTKESHATNIQHIIAQYFMTQRIKADDPQYTKKLTAAHAVMVSAMQSKQSADPATADALRKAILDFYRAYEGREPELEEE